MRELEHADLFKPPKGTKAIVIPCCGEYWEKGKTMTTPMDTGYAFIARTKWKNLHIVLGILQWRMGSSCHPLTAAGDDGKIYLPGKHGTLPLSHHLISFPTRRYKEQPITVDNLCAQLRALRVLLEKIPWLKTGDIVLPQICDTDEPWSHWKPHVEAYLTDDRFVVISGKPGTVT